MKMSLKTKIFLGLSLTTLLMVVMDELIIVYFFNNNFKLTLEQDLIIFGLGSLAIFATLSFTIGKNLESKIKQIEKLEELEKLLEALGRSQAFVKLSTSGEILDANQAFLEIFGYQLNEIKNQNHSILVEDNSSDSKEYQEFWKVLRSGKDSQGLFKRKHKSGKTIFISADYNPVFDQNNQISYIFKSCVDITDQVVKREKYLTEISKELTLSNQHLENLAFIASHDLKEPLRKAVSFSNLLMDEYAANLDSQAQYYINGIKNSSIRMQTMIEDLLFFSRIKNHRQETTKINFNNIMLQAMSNVEPQVKDKSASLILNSSIDDSFEIEGNETQLVRVFQNLLSNAIKYQKNGNLPVVKISIEDLNNEIEIIIEDNGIGFEEQYKDKIFDLFQRLHGKSEYSGSGIGLSIVKNIIEKHQGQISVQSTVNVGSRFSIKLPKQQISGSDNIDMLSRLRELLLD